MSTLERDPSRTRAFDRAGWVDASLGLSAVAVATVTVVLALVRPAYDRMADLSVYLHSASWVGHGHPLYAYRAPNGDPFNYPPVAILPFFALNRLPMLAARLVFAGLCLAAVAVIAVVLVKRWPTPLASPHRPVLLVTLGLLISAPVQSDLRFGQISVIVVALAFADAAEVTSCRSRGALIGVAAAIKVTPLLFMAYLLLARRWADAARAAGAFTAATALGWLVLPADSRTFFVSTRFTVNRVGDLAALGNQSLNGVLLRSGIPGPGRPLVWLVLVAVIVAIALSRAVALRKAGLTAPAAAMVGCATLAASPISWTHHQVWSVLAAMLLLATTGRVSHVAGVVGLLIMTVSVFDVTSLVTGDNGLLFLAANARAVFTAVLCVVGFGTFHAVRHDDDSSARTVFRPSLAALIVAAIAFLLVPLPAQLAGTVRPVGLPALRPILQADQQAAMGYVRDHGKVRKKTIDDMVSWGDPVNYSYGDRENGDGLDGIAASDVTHISVQAAPGGQPVDVPILRTSTGVGVFAIHYEDGSYLQLLVFGPGGTLMCECGDKARGR